MYCVLWDPQRSQPPSGLGTLPAFTRLAARPPLPIQRQDSNSSSELLRQLNYVRRTYISAVPHSHTRRLPHLLIQTATLSLQIGTSSIEPTNTHDTPRFIKPVRRYSPPHHTTSSSHQPNPLQHREQTHRPHLRRDMHVLSLPLPTPTPSFHTLTRPHWKTHLRLTISAIPLYFTVYMVFYLAQAFPTYMYSLS
jgi:hypothetical protein